MIGTDSNHYRIVAESLAGKKEVNEQTFASMAVLEERLERLKKLDDVFSGVEFSPDAAKILRRKNMLAIG